MSQKLVTEAELVTHLNEEITKHEECADCRFEHVMQLRKLDPQGCNWSEPNLRCSGQPASICLPIARQVVHAARARFNLK